MAAADLSRAYQVRLARLDEIQQLSSLLAEVFFDDPVYRWFFPDGRVRLRKCQRLFAGFLEDLVPHRTVFTTDGREGVALWIGPDQEEDWKTQIRKAIRIVPIFGFRILLGLLWWQKIESKHPRYPHWYLFLVGVAPRFQGRGIGSALLKPMIARCDEENLPIYLDTGNEANVPFYQRKGFRVFREVALPRGPKVFQMIRQPGGN